MHIEFWRHKTPNVSGSANVENIATAKQVEKSAKGGDFKTLMNKMEKADDALEAGKAKQDSAPPVLKFSNHAVERMSARGIHFTPQQITDMEMAAKKAADKGGKDALLITKDSAAIVSLKNNTVVTVVDRDALKNNVFTNIDSTVFI